MAEIPLTNLENVVAMDYYYPERKAKIYYKAATSSQQQSCRRVEYTDVGEADFFFFQGRAEKVTKLEFVEQGSKKGDEMRHFQRSDLVPKSPPSV